MNYQEELERCLRIEGQLRKENEELRAKIDRLEQELKGEPQL